MEKIITGNANRNTFVIINQNIDDISTIDIKKLCSKFKTDALLYLNYKNKCSITLDYYNNDGTWETFCINGLTCAAIVLHNELFKKEYNVLCGSGEYKIKIIEKNVVKIEIPNPVYKTQKIDFGKYAGYYIDSGAKHFVIKIKSKWPNKNQLIKDAKKIRYNTKYFPNGINVNFYKVINDNTIEVKTYEKGVEKLMDSCASGSYAAAFHFRTNQKQIFIINKGGNFSIKFTKSNKKNYLLNKGETNYIN